MFFKLSGLNAICVTYFQVIAYSPYFPASGWILGLPITEALNKFAPYKDFTLCYKASLTLPKRDIFPFQRANI